jgi:ATP-dependent Clp protease adaptor protein ClpS
MNATKVDEAQRARTAKKARTEPPWNVILHNDWDNSMTRVVGVLVRVIPGMTLKRATKHTKGQAVATSCHKELAELYEERLRGKGLTVSSEPAR